MANEDVKAKRIGELIKRAQAVGMHNQAYELMESQDTDSMSDKDIDDVEKRIKREEDYKASQGDLFKQYDQRIDESKDDPDETAYEDEAAKRMAAKGEKVESPETGKVDVPESKPLGNKLTGKGALRRMLFGENN